MPTLSPPVLQGTGFQRVPFWSSALGHQTDYSKDARDQSREAGSLGRLSGSVETSAKCVSPADYRKRLQNPVWFLSTSLQWDFTHSGWSLAGLGIGTKGQFSFCKRGHRIFSSSRKRDSGFYSQYFMGMSQQISKTYFQISILPHHGKFLRFAFGDEVYQYRVLPFGLALSPPTLTKCVDPALAWLQLQGIQMMAVCLALKCFFPDLRFRKFCQV